MSFDLTFVAAGKMPESRALVASLQRLAPNAAVNSDQGMIGYENEQTGVYFQLSCGPDSLNLHLNYFRPTYFALETFGALGGVAEEFSLAVLDPDDGGRCSYSAETLLGFWKKGNAFTCSAFRAMGQDFPWMEERKATELWNYRRLHSRLEVQFDLGFVPRLDVVNVGGAPQRTAHLTRPTIYVMPPADLLYLENKKVVRTERILEVLRPYLTPVAGAEWLMATHEDTMMDTDIMEVWEAMYDSIEPDLDLDELNGRFVALDGFVDAVEMRPAS